MLAFWLLSLSVDWPSPLFRIPGQRPKSETRTAILKLAELFSGPSKPHNQFRRADALVNSCLDIDVQSDALLKICVLPALRAWKSALPTTIGVTGVLAAELRQLSTDINWKLNQLAKQLMKREMSIRSSGRHDELRDQIINDIARVIQDLNSTTAEGAERAKACIEELPRQEMGVQGGSTTADPGIIQMQLEQDLKHRDAGLSSHSYELCVGALGALGDAADGLQAARHTLTTAASQFHVMVVQLDEVRGEGPNASLASQATAVFGALEALEEGLRSGSWSASLRRGKVFTGLFREEKAPPTEGPGKP